MIRRRGLRRKRASVLLQMISYFSGKLTAIYVGALVPHQESLKAMGNFSFCHNRWISQGKMKLDVLEIISCEFTSRYTNDDFPSSVSPPNFPAFFYGSTIHLIFSNSPFKFDFIRFLSKPIKKFSYFALWKLHLCQLYNELLCSTFELNFN